MRRQPDGLGAIEAGVIVTRSPRFHMACTQQALLGNLHDGAHAMRKKSLGADDALSDALDRADDTGSRVLPFSL